LPDELKRREDRLAKIRQAKTRLEAEARVKRSRTASPRRKQTQREAEVANAGQRPAPAMPLQDKAPDEPSPTRSEDMKQSKKGFDIRTTLRRGDADEQIIVAARY